MRLTKTFLMGLAGLCAGSLMLSILEPKTAHAMVAALVQVANTRANPVPNQDVDHPARNSFTATCAVESIGDVISCVPSPTPASANTKIVIQNVNMRVVDANGDPSQAGILYTLLLYNSGGNQVEAAVPFVAQGSGNWAVNQPVTLYADPAQAATTSCYAGVVDYQNQHSLICTISGYSVAIP